MCLLKLLLWKNYIIKIRHPKALLIEICIPCIFFLVLAIIRYNVLSKTQSKPIVYESFKLIPDKFESFQVDEDNKKTPKLVIRLIYSPQNNATDSMVKFVEDALKVYDVIRLIKKGFNNEDDMVNYYLNTTITDRFLGISFKNITNHSLNVKIRLAYTPHLLNIKTLEDLDNLNWQTEHTFPIIRVPGSRSPEQKYGGTPSYYRQGFLAVQQIILYAYLNTFHSDIFIKYAYNYTILLQRMPFPPYSEDRYLHSLRFFIPMIILVSFIYPISNLTKTIVQEKEQRFTSMAAMMGLNQSTQWLAHFITAFIANLICIFIIVIIIKMPLNHQDLKVLTYSEPTFLIFWLTLFVCTNISYCFFISSLFSNASIAGVLSGSIYFMSFLPYYYITFSYGSHKLGVKLLFSIIPNLNMSFACMLLSMWETEHYGLKWSNLFHTASSEDQLTMAHLIFVQIIVFILFMLTAFYISNVWPGEYGIPRDWNFFLSKNYWRNNPIILSNDNAWSDSVYRTTLLDISGIKETKTTSKTALNSFVSTVKKSLSEYVLKCGPRGSSTSFTSRNIARNQVVLNKLYKSYHNNRNYAVKNLSLQMFQNEITVLLGHNGAGKSTLMNMLCGLIVPTKGEISIFGNNLFEDVDLVRKELGICLQFDVLFDELTVAEHLYFYSMIKKVDPDKIDKEIESIIDMLDLKPKTHSFSSTLSGGMKRKLSVGIALIGGSRLVILDEATSGMDVSARRFIWDLLLKEKKERVILISTHFMEEADVLGDKVAIMEAGELKCYGTPMKLKKDYGQGYLLRISLKDTANKCIRDQITELITQIKDSKIITSIGNEMTFSLPEKESKYFKKLFQNIEKNSKKLSILNFGISVTTLEEVFLRVGDFAKEGILQSNLNDSQINKCSQNNIIHKLQKTSKQMNHGYSHKLQIFKAMFAKKHYFIMNNFYFLISLFVIPPIILIISILLNTDGSESSDVPLERQLDLTGFDGLKSFIFHDSNSTDLAESIVNYYNNVDISEIYNTTNEFVESYLIEKGKENLRDYSNKLMFSFKYDNSFDKPIIGFFNNEAYHTAPIVVTTYNEMIIRYLTKNDTFKLSFSNHPMPKKITEKLHMLSFHSIKEVQLCFALTFSLSFLMASFTIIVISEVSSNFRHIQQISGLSLKCFWITHFLMDYIYWTFGGSLLVLVIYISNIAPYNNFIECFYILVSISLLGFPALPFVYCLSFTVNDPTSGYVRISLYMCVIGAISYLAVTILRIPAFELQQYSSSIEGILQYFIPIFTIPSQAFSIGKNRRAVSLCKEPIEISRKMRPLISVCDNQAELNKVPGAKVCCETLCGAFCYIQKNFWDWEKPGTLQFIVGYIVQTALFWTILYMIETRKLFQIKKLINKFVRKKNILINLPKGERIEDDDVENEKKRILNSTVKELAVTDAMWVKGLSKKYGDFIAVDNIYFGVKKTECFGILGINGAGKTTTFKMITGAETISSGEIYIHRMNVLHNLSEVYKFIGYCPQFNGLLEQLTGRETLMIISRIRGIHESMIQEQIDILSKLFYFQKHIDKKVYEYSGGTKRKLSMACSVVGNPMILFLDEPSTGVDPVSRRCLWNAIEALRAGGSSIVLTSHSMEECEALCNRLMIMVNAKLRCIGSSLHLKNKYGAGYVIHIKCKARTKRKVINQIVTQILDHFGKKSKLEFNHNKQLTFKLESNDFPLSEIFGYIEDLKQLDDSKIEDYSVVQTSLEKIFLSFAREQVDALKKKN